LEVAGIADQPTALQALLAALALLAHRGPARSVFVPVWATYPAYCFGDRDALPRSQAAAGPPPGWSSSCI
jgi:hypothetical protein